MIGFDYVRPSSAKNAIDAITRDTSAQFIAGGTNLVDLMKMGVTAPQKLVDINGLSLRTIELTNNKLKIGALALNSEVAEHPLIKQHAPLLAKAINAGASPQIRNMATVGGNMLQRTRCSYFFDLAMPCNKRNPGSGCGALKGYNRMHAVFGASDNCIAVHPSDMCVALAALNAQVFMSGPDGDRSIAFTDFHRLPANTPQLDNNLKRGELITAIEIPVENFEKNVQYLKVRDRSSYAFALVSVAVALKMEGRQIKEARVAMGGVAHKPWRLAEVEQFLEGKLTEHANFVHAGQLAFHNAKGYGYNDFKLKMGPNAIVQALTEASNF